MVCPIEGGGKKRETEGEIELLLLSRQVYRGGGRAENEKEAIMYPIDFAGFLILISYMLVRLLVPILVMIVLAKLLRAIVPQTL